MHILQKGAHLVIEAAFKYLDKGSDGCKGGVVVNLSSTAGITCVGDMYTVPAYTTSKHAVTTLTRTFGVRNQITRDFWDTNLFFLPPRRTSILIAPASA